MLISEEFQNATGGAIMKRQTVLVLAVGFSIAVFELCKCAFADLYGTSGSIVAWNQTDVPVGNDFTAIAAGGYHSLAIKSDGSLVEWGANTYFQTDIPAGSDFVSIAGGKHHSDLPPYILALKSDGSLAAWGRNDWGESDVPLGDDFVGITAGDNDSMALRADGSLIGWGQSDHSGGYDVLNLPPGNDFMAVSTSYWDHCLELKNDGLVVAWVNNDWGQAETPAGNDFVAIATGSYLNLAIKTDGSLAAWDYLTDVPSSNDFVARVVDLSLLCTRSVWNVYVNIFYEVGPLIVTGVWYGVVSRVAGVLGLLVSVTGIFRLAVTEASDDFTGSVLSIVYLVGFIWLVFCSIVVASLVAAFVVF